MKKTNIIIAYLSLVATAAFALDAKIDTSKTYQTIDNFTAADAWCGNLVGRYFDDAQKGQIAKWLFSQKIGASALVGENRTKINAFLTVSLYGKR